MITLNGKGVSPGIASGTLFFFKRASFAVVEKNVTDTADEVARFHAARIEAGKQLDSLCESVKEKIGSENAQLFEVHRMMLDDTDFTDPIVALIEKRSVCAQWAVAEIGAALAKDFSEMDDEYMKERASDIKDVTQRVVNILIGVQSNPTLSDTPVILAADDFTPSETAALDRAKVLAMVSQAGAANSHTAIFARTMGIPAVIGVGQALEPDFSGKAAALDGEAGLLYIEPENHILASLEQKQSDLEEKNLGLEKFCGKETTTKDGRTIKLYANIGSSDDVEAALAWDAEGIGLFRSEFLYLGRDDYPSEDFQYANYRKVVEAMAGKPVVIRTLDIGADKQVEYFNLPHEENPALGMRAIRICLTQPEIFKIQLRAIYRSSAYGNVGIMFPMISSVWEFIEAKKYALEVRDELAAENIPFDEKVPIGIMIETPAAVMISDLLAREADFFSIGTNDLIQYTLAVDRQNESIGQFVDTHHEAIIRMIRLTAENAHKAGICCSICGSLGGDFALTETFINAGLQKLSVEPSRILELRSRIAQI